MSSNERRANRTLFWGLMRAQIMALLAWALLVTLVAGPLAGLAAAWGATISLIAYAWGGFQVWLHPANHAPKRMATAAVRAEVGKIAIMLLLFWLTFSKVPDAREMKMALLLLLGFLLAQVAGWIQVARLEHRRAAAEHGQDD